MAGRMKRRMLELRLAWIYLRAAARKFRRALSA